MKREELYRLEKEYNYKSLCVQYEIDKNKLKKDKLIKIFSVVFKKLNGHELSVAHKISKKYHLDFIDWNKYENEYVVIVCKNKINLKTN